MTRPTLTFHGAAGTVTGSRHHLRGAHAGVLVDCGLFQGRDGRDDERGDNQRLDLDAASLDAVLLTHAHLDHCGYLPRLVRDGFRGRVLATAATRDLCRIILRDSAWLAERGAELAARRGLSRPPLYTQKDVHAAMALFEAVEFGERVEVARGVWATFSRAGHILGAASVLVEIDGVRVLVSGDLGRRSDPLMAPPEPAPAADYLVIESTYGDRAHSGAGALARLEAVVDRVAARGGTLVIPAFSVGRTQTLLYLLSALKASGRIRADLPVFLDSPMAIAASDVHEAHPDDHALSAGGCARAFGVADYVHSSDASRALDTNPFPKIILCASGMAEGGRVLHHLKAYLGDAASAVLFAGFQAPGTRGEALLGGAERVRIHGRDYPVHADILELDMLSAHADADELLDWAAAMIPPRRAFVVHGTPDAAATLAARLEDELDWNAVVAERGRTHALHASQGTDTETRAVEAVQ